MMSSESPDQDRTERPDADAWATASAEDIAAENNRRRAQSGYGPGSAAEELRRLADAVADRIADLGNPTVTMAAQGLASQVKAVVEPIRDRNPDVFDHLAAAGSELLAAYRSAVARQERRWTAEAKGADEGRGEGGGQGGGPDGGERIDLD
jgi:Family of unknown function (DUF5304)